MTIRHFTIRKLIVCLGACAFACAIAWESEAQAPACEYYKVQANNANVSKEPKADAIFIDLLDKGEIVCVSREQKAGGRDWSYIPYKLPTSGEHTTVDGWVGREQLQQLSPDEAASLPSGAESKSAGASAGGKPSEVSPPTEESRRGTRPSRAVTPGVTAKTQTARANTPAPESKDEVIRYSRPIQFGAYPVVGKSIEELAKGIPLFPPFEGLDESEWKKHCSGCHQWNRNSLCVQGGTYAKNPRTALRHPHPYGGVFKSALMQWAKTGCQ